MENMYIQNTLIFAFKTINELANTNTKMLVEMNTLNKKLIDLNKVNEEQRKMIEYLKKSMKEINNQIIVERSMGKG